MRHIDSVKKAIVFTDIKDFTLKNSLLTQKQIREYLSMQDELIFPLVKQNNGELVKTMGDAYMIVFDSAIDAVRMAIDIEKALDNYNRAVNYNLYKIELRITINYGELQKEETVFGVDYFGDVVNIASRLQYSVEENRIFATSNVIEEIKDIKSFRFKFLGRTALRGILQEIEVYEIIFDNSEVDKKTEGWPRVEDRAGGIFMSDNLKEKVVDVNNTIIEFSLITSLAGMEIIPYIGGYIMLPFHYFLLKKIANKYGVIGLSANDFKAIIITISVSIGGTFAIQQFGEILLKTEYAGFIGYVTFILNFVLAYIIGRNLSEYYLRRSQKVEVKNKAVKDMFKKTSISVKKNFSYNTIK